MVLAAMGISGPWVGAMVTITGRTAQGWMVTRTALMCDGDSDDTWIESPDASAEKSGHLDQMLSLNSKSVSGLLR